MRTINFFRRILSARQRFAGRRLTKAYYSIGFDKEDGWHIYLKIRFFVKVNDDE